MEKISEEQVLDLSAVGNQFNQLSKAQVVSGNPLSIGTNFILDQSITKNQSLVINDVGVLASPRKGKELLVELDKTCLHHHSQKERLLNQVLGQRYRYPLMTTKGIFCPFEKHVWKSDVWMNLMQITALEGLGTTTDCCVTFQNGYKLVLPKSLRAIKRSIQKDLAYSYLYFSFFEKLVLSDLPVTIHYSRRISEKATELSLAISTEMDGPLYNKMKEQLEYIVTQDYFKRIGQSEFLEEVELCK